jgi:acetolactate synthase-1/2/3 large subunit
LAAQYGLDLIVIVIDNSAYGTIRMHQEREFPGRVTATDLANPDFAALARAFGGWATRVETAAEFADALDDALGRKGVRLIHCISDIERLSAAGATVSGLRAKA